MVTARHLFDLAAAENAAGGYFPLWGTCLGFQTLSVLASSAAVLDSGFDSENLPLPLTFTELADKSRLFSSVSPSIKTSLATGKDSRCALYRSLQAVLLSVSHSKTLSSLVMQKM